MPKENMFELQQQQQKNDEKKKINVNKIQQITRRDVSK